MKNKRISLFIPLLALFSLASCKNGQEASLNDSGIKGTDEVKPSQIIYVSSDSTNIFASGTKEDPMSIENAIRTSQPGALIYLLDGVYKSEYPIKVNSETENNPATKGHVKTLKPLNKGNSELFYSLLAISSRILHFALSIFNSL